MVNLKYEIGSTIAQIVTHQQMFSTKEFAVAGQKLIAKLIFYLLTTLKTLEKP